MLWLHCVVKQANGLYSYSDAIEMKERMPMLADDHDVSEMKQPDQSTDSVSLLCSVTHTLFVVSLLLLSLLIVLFNETEFFV